MTFIDRLMFCAFEVGCAPAAAAGAAAVSAVFVIAAFVFLFYFCVSQESFLEGWSPSKMGQPSTNALNTYLDTSWRSLHAVESNL